MFFHVWFKPHTVRIEDAASGRFHVVALDFDTLDAAIAALNEPGLIRGDNIHSRFSGHDVRTITRREPFAFSGSAVDRIQPSPWAFSDGEG